MKVFGGSILSHYSRWCPVQARLVQSLETNWEGKKRERQRKAKREKDVGYSLNSLFVSVIYTSKIVLGRERTDQFILSAQECSHTSSTLLGRIMKAKVRLLFFIFLGLSNSSIVSVQVQRWTFPIMSMHPPRFASRISHRCNIGPRPAWHPTLLCSSASLPHTHTHTHTHTHINPLPPFWRSSWSPPDPNSWGRRRCTDLSSPWRGEKEENICHRSSFPSLCLVQG